MRGLGAGPSDGGQRITLELDQLDLTRGLPRIIRSDNGPKLIGKALLNWAYVKGITPLQIEPGKPNQNTYIESFNSRFRDECLSKH